MRLLVGVVAASIALAAPAYAIDFSLPSLPTIPCLMFCDSKPAAKPQDGKPIAPPRDLHPARRRYDEASAVGQSRFSRHVHASKPIVSAYRAPPAAALHPVPTPPKPSPVVAAAPPAPAVALASATPASEPSPVLESPAAVAQASAPAVAPAPTPAAQEPDPGIRMLAEAFSESPPPTPTPVQTPEAVAQAPTSPVAEAVAAPPKPLVVAMVGPAEPSAIVQVTANGLVFPWWPSHFPARAAVCVVALALIAAGAFGLVRASGRRLAA